MEEELRGWFSWQLTADRKSKVDSLTGSVEPLQPGPHALWCYCGYCRPELREEDKSR